MLKATPYEQSLNDDHTNFGWCKIFDAFHIQKIGPDFKSKIDFIILRFSSEEIRDILLLTCIGFIDTH